MSHDFMYIVYISGLYAPHSIMIRVFSLCPMDVETGIPQVHEE
jgi:hypothetical protein